MTKAEIIERYGIETYNKYCERRRERHKTNKEQENQLTKEWKLKNKDKNLRLYKTWQQNNPEYFLRRYCEKIEYVFNYELAKADNFVGWSVHHILENYWSSDDLKKKGLYYNVNPEALIFIRSEIHHVDMSKNPKNSKWHKRYYSELKK